MREIRDQANQVRAASTPGARGSLAQPLEHAIELHADRLQPVACSRVLTVGHMQARALLADEFLVGEKIRIGSGSSGARSSAGSNSAG